jgi:uncharacterized membrane protein YkoI
MKMFALAAAVLFATVPYTSASADEVKGSIQVSRFKKADYPNQAKVTMQEAIEAALKKSPGKAVEAELESEDGFLVYEVKVVGPDKKKTEIKVDAGNLAILNVEKTNSMFE